MSLPKIKNEYTGEKYFLRGMKAVRIRKKTKKRTIFNI